MTFREDVARFTGKVTTRGQQLHAAVSDLAFTSIVEGSPVTGAPGQPVAPDAPPGVRTLKGSWQQIPEGPLRTAILTDVPYAPDIEDGARNGRALTLRSKIGGFHSVKLTRTGWHRLVEAALKVVGHA